MSAPNPNSILKELRKDVSDFYGSIVHTDVYDRNQHADLLRRCAELARTDVVEASLLQADIASCTGNIPEYERWVRNAEKNNGVHQARHIRFQHAVNQGFATDAQALIADCLRFKEGMNLMQLAVGMFSVGAFQGILDAVDEFDANQGVLMMTTLLKKTKDVAAVTNELSIDDASIARMLDVAGEVLREHKLMWESDAPEVLALSSSKGGPAICFEYVVTVTPAEASAMSWELAEKLVDRNLDRPCVTVGFLGNRVQ